MSYIPTLSFLSFHFVWQRHKGDQFHVANSPHLCKEIHCSSWNGDCKQGRQLHTSHPCHQSTPHPPLPSAFTPPSSAISLHPSPPCLTLSRFLIQPPAPCFSLHVPMSIPLSFPSAPTLSFLSLVLPPLLFFFILFFSFHLFFPVFSSSIPFFPYRFPSNFPNLVSTPYLSPSLPHLFHILILFLLHHCHDSCHAPSICRASINPHRHDKWKQL
ncbi:hypothetical protein E2C01_053158 [Portunus trituberculatus]|uniref:Uncharacterized protein n=1 Tax=Portunus trituberculatus TaxID=210409 RepID=A0A5B7GNK2_PORTR|nr:hypothetical protein [Portunus trituberculatus]